MKCNFCGVSSDLEIGFIRDKRTFSKDIISCVTCHRYILNQKTSRIYWSLLAVLTASVGLIFLSDKGSWFLFNIVLFCVALYLSIIPHELGHALGAVITGQEVFHITFGGGRRIYSTRICKVFIEIRMFPTEGLIFKKCESKQFIKLRQFIVVLFGPLANAAIALVVWLAFSDQLQHINPFDEPDPLKAIFLANCYSAASNLLPFNINSSFGKAHSDGKQLLTIPFMSKSQVDEYFKSHTVTTAYFAFHNNDLELCEKLCEEGLSSYPDSIALKIIMSCLLCKKIDYSAARSLLIDEIKNPSITEIERSMAENVIAWCDYLSANPELLEEADCLSESAMKTMPWSLAFRATRGSILIENDQIEAGIALLSDKRLAIEEHESQALSACALSIGYAKQGNIEKAREILKQAELLDPKSVLLDRARKALSACT